MYRFRPVFCAFMLVVVFSPIVLAQEVTTRHVINITLNSPSARQLAINRGRLIWRETDPNTSNENFRYFSGAEIFLLDSNLTGGTSALDGDIVVWNTSSGIVKTFNTRTWDTTWLGACYNPDGLQPVSVANGMIAYARSKSGTGTLIALHRDSGGADTTLDAGTWNTEPSVSHDQVAWTSSASQSVFAPSDIYLFDGINSRNISRTAGMRNSSPLVRDGQVIWLQDSTGSSAVMLRTRDTIITVGAVQSPSELVVGHDASDGIGIAAFCDTSTHVSRITMYDEGTRLITGVVDSEIISSVHIDNGVVVWRSGTSGGITVKFLPIATGIIQSMAAGENPVIDDDVVAWTLGDAVELDVVLTYEQLTSDLKNGWEQSRFKPIDYGNIAFGNYEQSQHTRLYYADSTTKTQVADSTLPNDFVMANDGVMIWRENADTLWMYSGSGPRVKLLDSLQVENMFVANGFISFDGYRLNGGGGILQAWLYDIAGRTLKQLSHEDTNTTVTNIVNCDGNSAAWNRDSSHHHMIMFYDGLTAHRLSANDTVGDKFSYRNGVIAWSEVVNGIEQILVYDTATHTTTQLTQGNTPSTRVVTDGKHVVWYSDFVTRPTMYYHDLASGITTKVAHTSYQNFRWDWLSNGKITWTSNGDVFLYDGKSISQITTSGQPPPNKEPYVDNDYVVWNRVDPSNPIVEGNIFRGKLHAHPSFAAKNIYGLVPLTVSFTNSSWQGTQSYWWEFGDGGTSSLPDPNHVYSVPGRYSVSLTVTDPTGSRSEKKTLLVNAVVSTGIEDKIGALPHAFALYQNYPNPFNPATTIRFAIRDAGFVSLKVYDILGREVATIVNQILQPGAYTRPWDARNVPSGVYTYKLTSGTFSEARRMILIK